MPLGNHVRGDMNYIRTMSDMRKRKENRLISMEIRISDLEKEIKLLKSHRIGCKEFK